jgi:DNA-binding FadR family transcriptional regulator
MPIQAVETRRLYRQIADQLTELIGSGEFEAGERLPPERDLAAQLGVSRPSVREALIALEVEGYVEVRVGSGVYVTRPDKRAGNARRLDAHSGPFELIRARWLIESECAALAAREGTPSQLHAIEQAYDEMVRDTRAGDNEATLGADWQFHERIAEAANNSALVLVVRTLWEQRMGPLFMQLENHFTHPSTWTTVHREHRDILSAIVRHDPRGARAAMRRHMDNAAKRFSLAWNEPAAIHAAAAVAKHKKVAGVPARAGGTGRAKGSAERGAAARRGARGGSERGR